MIKMFDQNKTFPLISLSLFGKRDVVSASATGKGLLKFPRVPEPHDCRKTT